MKVYIFTRQPMPNGMAGTNRIKCYARALHSVGVSCGIFVFSRDEGNHLACGDIDGVRFRYMLGFARRWASILGKIQTILMMVALYVKFLFCLKKDDVVFEYSRESYKFVNLIIKLTHFKQAKYVSELCEIPGLGFTHKEAIEENKYIESRLFPQYDGVVAISGSLAHYAKQHCTNYCKIIEVPVLVDSKAFQLTNEERPIKEPYIFYSGSFDDQKDGTIGMFQAFCKVANTVTSTLKFVCAGTKEAALQVGYLSKYIQDEKLEQSLILHSDFGERCGVDDSVLHQVLDGCALAGVLCAVGRHDVHALCLRPIGADEANGAVRRPPPAHR